MSSVNPLQLLRSNTAHKRPDPAGLVDGRPAINTNVASPGLFFKDSSGALVKVGPVHVGTTAPNASPASGGSAGNSVGEQWLDTTGGTYVFKVWDGSAWRSESGTFVDVNGDVMTGALGIIAGSAGSPGLYFSGDTNTGLYSPGADQVAISTGGTGRLFVDASGNISTGTSNVSGAVTGRNVLTLNGTSSTILSFYHSSAFKSYIVHNGNDLEVTNIAAGFLGFGTNGTERLRITSAGLVGVGTSSPAYLFHIGNASGDASAFIGQSSTTGLFWQWRYNATVASAYGELSTYGGNNNIYIQGQSGGGNTILNPLSGRVGVGTTTPQVKLTTVSTTTFNGVTNCTFRSSDDATSSFYIGHGSGGISNLISDSALGFGYVSGGAYTERARIDSSGRLLVGTSSAPSYFGGSPGFSVNGTGNDSFIAAARYNSSNAFGADITFLRSRSGTVGAHAIVQSGDTIGSLSYLGSDGSSFILGARISAEVDGTPGANDMPGRLVFSTTADGASSPTERMRITQSGHTLFGRIAAGLTTAGAGFIANAGGGYFEMVQSGNGVACLYISQNYNSGTQTAVDLRYNNTQVGTINVTSTATSYNTSSDYRLKENIELVTDATDRIKALKPYRFNFIADPDKTVDGFIAHEVQTVVPEAITGEKDAVDEDGNPVYQGIDQSKLVPLLTAALQEAVAKIENLEARLTAASI